MAGFTCNLKDFTTKGNSFTSSLISNFLALGEALGFQERRDSWSEVFPQNAAFPRIPQNTVGYKAMWLLQMNVYTSRNVLKKKKAKKRGPTVSGVCRNMDSAVYIVQTE